MTLPFAPRVPPSDNSLAAKPSWTPHEVAAPFFASPGKRTDHAWSTPLTLSLPSIHRLHTDNERAPLTGVPLSGATFWTTCEVRLTYLRTVLG